MFIKSQVFLLLLTSGATVASSNFVYDITPQEQDFDAIWTPTTSTNNNLRRHLNDRPSCPNQSSCHDFGNGWLGYSVHKKTADGSCQESCAAGGSLTYALDVAAFECGKCPQMSCPNQAPCRDFGNGYLGYTVHKVEDNGSCVQYCSAGNALTNNLVSGEYKCGACPMPTCAAQEPCMDYGDGVKGYPVHRMDYPETGSCMDVCAMGTQLSVHLQNGFVCGKCVEQEQPTCPNETPCDTGSGWDAYPLYKINPDGVTCIQACASGFYITQRQQDGFVCGTCPVAAQQAETTCPGQEPCHVSSTTGIQAYSLFRMDGTTCTQTCAGGSRITTRLAQGFACGECPPL